MASTSNAESSLWLASQGGRCWEVEAVSPQHFDQQILQNALHVAIANDHAGVVPILLRAGALLDGSRTPIQLSPVQSALRYDSADTLRTLLEAKARVNWLPFGNNSATIAVRYEAMKCMQVLVLAKADLTLADNMVATTAVLGQVGMLHLLVQGKASIDAKSWGVTPVHAAAHYGQVYAVDLLIRAKADATRCTADTNESPLFVAAVRGHAAVVRYLLAHVPALAAVATQQHNYFDGVRIVAGSTPLDVARQLRHNEVVALLVAATAKK